MQQQEVQLRYFTVTAPTAGIVGDVPVRVGNQVSPQTMLTTIDQNETLELNVNVPVERAGALRNGLPLQVLGNDGNEIVASTTVDFISPRVDDQTQSVLVKAQVRNPDGRLRVVAVRPRAHHLEDVRRAGRAGDRGPPHQRPVLRLRRRGCRRQAGGEAARDQGRSDCRQQLSGPRRASKPGERVVTSGAQKLADGAPIQAAPDPASPAQPPAAPKQ